jgi:hypothetical protein
MSGNPRTWSDAYWDFFVTDCRRLQAPLYERLSEGMRRDPALCELAALSRLGQPPANMLFGAVHYLLLRGAQHPLRRHYRTLTAGPPPGEDPFPLFRDFCLQHHSDIAQLIAAHVTNTNEVGRCVFLLPAFQCVAEEAPAPLHIVEIGASAGLNLYWDHYGYRYVRADGDAIAGNADAPLHLETELSGGMPPLGRPPRVGFRIGIEHHPVDLARSEDRDWLRALVWPDHPQRLERLDRALDFIARQHPDIRTGDALSLLLEVAAEAPKDGTLVVFHTMTTYQFSREDKAALEDLLTVAGLRRPVWRISMEWDGTSYPLLLDRYADGVKMTRLLGLCTGHGNALEWRG